MARRNASPELLGAVGSRAKRDAGKLTAFHRRGAHGTSLAHDEHHEGALAHGETADPDLAGAHLSVVAMPPVALVNSISPRLVKRRLMLADLAAAIMGLAAAFVLQEAIQPADSSVLIDQWLLALVSIPFWYAAATANNLYTGRANVREADELKHIVGAVLVGLASMIGIGFVFQVEAMTRGWALILFATVTVSLAVERRFARSFFRKLRRDGRLARPILVVGTDANATSLVRTMQRRPELGYAAVGFVGSAEPADPCGIPVLGDIGRIEGIAAMVGATGVVISLYSMNGPTVNQLTRRLTDAGLHVTLCSSLRDIDLHRVRVQALDGQTMMYIEPTIRTGWRRAAMRVFDHVVSVAVLILASPIMAAAAIAIRLESSGPILFRQRRVGLDGKPFDIIKFRTMAVGADEMKAALIDENESDGPLFKMSCDPRVTRVGRVLRKYSIDELPQFWNVIRGEMSVVGPRPALPSEVAQWDTDVHERLRVLPGVTGIWQVSGRSRTTFEEYKRLDLYYVDNWSLLHDVRIVARTFKVVVSGNGDG